MENEDNEDNISVTINGGEVIPLDKLITQVASNNLNHVAILKLSDVEQITLISQRLAEVLTENSSLTSLWLYGTFDDEGAINIATELPRMSSLEHITINAKFGDDGAKAICEAVSEMPTISSLNLYAPLTDYGVEEVISLIEKKPNLVEVDIYPAEISATCFERLLQVLKTNTSLLRFGFPSLCDGDTVQENLISDCFSENSTLRYCSKNSLEQIKWYAKVNKVSKEVGKREKRKGRRGNGEGEGGGEGKRREKVPQYLGTEEEIREFLEREEEEEEEDEEGGGKDGEKVKHEETKEGGGREEGGGEEKGRGEMGRHGTYSSAVTEVVLEKLEKTENLLSQIQFEDEKMRGKIQDILEQCEEQIKEELNKLEVELVEQVTQLEEDHKELVAIIRAENDEKIANQEEVHKGQIQHLKVEHKLQLKLLSDKYEMYLQQETEQHKEKIAQVAKDHKVQLQKQTQEEKEQFATYKIVLQKKLAKLCLSKALDKFQQVQLAEAKCLLQFAFEIEQSEDITKIGKEKEEKGGNGVIDFNKVGMELQTQIEEQMKLTENEQQVQIEARIEDIKEEILRAKEQVEKAKSKEEELMIKQQMEILQQKEAILNEQLQMLEKRQAEIQEREEQMEKKEKTLQEHIKHLTELFCQLSANTTEDISNLQQQVDLTTSGDKDVDAARLRLFSSQKQLIEAQQRVRIEEKRQRERVELLQKTIELYQLKGMSPAQKSYRQYLKDVKRLSVVRNHMEHTPHPLRCFISYAWETDPIANKRLQERLQRLKDDLEVAGMEVSMDIHNMKDDMKKFMVHEITKAHKVLLICTPRLKERAAYTNENNLKLELKAACEKAKSTAAFIVPLIFSGHYFNAMPEEAKNLLAIDFTSDENSYHRMASLAPLGLIPMLLGLERHKDYKRTHDMLFRDIDEYGKQLKTQLSNEFK